MTDNRVYKKALKAHKVYSNQSKTRLYEVCFGEVDWGKNGETEFAIYILIYLLQEGKWNVQYYPPHILVMPGSDGKSDLDNVMEKIDLLKKEFLS